jgi:heat shock protein 1/8
LSKEEIERMLAEAEKYADEDKEAAERVAAKNAVEGYCYSLKQTLSENGDKFDAADKETLQTKVDEAISALDTMETATKSEFEEMQKELEQVSLFSSDP